jgi:hypothetical protein
MNISRNVSSEYESFISRNTEIGKSFNVSNSSALSQPCVNPFSKIDSLSMKDLQSLRKNVQKALIFPKQRYLR